MRVTDVSVKSECEISFSMLSGEFPFRLSSGYRVEEISSSTSLTFCSRSNRIAGVALSFGVGDAIALAVMLMIGVSMLPFDKSHLRRRLKQQDLLAQSRQACSTFARRSIRICGGFFCLVSQHHLNFSFRALMPLSRIINKLLSCNTWKVHRTAELRQDSAQRGSLAERWTTPEFCCVGWLCLEFPG